MASFSFPFKTNFMRRSCQISWIFTLIFFIAGCSKNKSGSSTPSSYSLSFTVNGNYNGSLTYKGLNNKPVIQINFTDAIQPALVETSVQLTNNNTEVPIQTTLGNSNRQLTLQPLQPLQGLTNYTLTVTNKLLSEANGTLVNPVSINLLTGIDSSDKFPIISDDALLDKVQSQTFKYFWDFGHPVSGLARERNTSGDVVTSGGSGFGIMAILAAIDRNFITRAQGFNRVQTIVNFLTNTAQKFHGAFPHWLNGTDGKAVPFSTKDDGADLVETSYLMQGLLCARQYFKNADVNETTLRTEINSLYNGVEWSWFRKNGANVLYWHWSPNYNWDMNVPITGWNECLITYVLAASSTTFPIPKSVYDSGWAQNGSMRNGKNFYGYVLPLGPDYGGPLFFSHYSFLGINPNGLTDQYANYQIQVSDHTRINYEYCKTNPKGYYGYSSQCWGLTASDIPSGYTASSPTNDVGVIAPTAALSSFPYTATESMQALKFFYYKLGDKLWGPYGFYDAFSLNDPWFASSYLAIDQGPIIVMIENYRSGLLWKLFMSCPEVKNGMKALGFQGPNL